MLDDLNTQILQMLLSQMLRPGALIYKGTVIAANKQLDSICSDKCVGKPTESVFGYETADEIRKMPDDSIQALNAEMKTGALAVTIHKARGYTFVSAADEEVSINTISNMLSGISRAMTMPLTNIYSAISLLENKLDIGANAQENSGVHIADDAQGDKQRGEAAVDVMSTKKYYAAILKSMHELLRLANNISDTGNAMVGKLPLNLEYSNISALYEGVIETADVHLNSVGVDIKFFSDPDKIYTRYDTRLMIRAVYALVSNIIKYGGGKGFFKLGVREKWVTISVVSHSGLEKGMELADVFDRFEKDDKRPESKSGAGYGIFIIKSVIQAHGGKMMLDINNNNEICVRIMLPLSPKMKKEELKTADLWPPVSVNNVLMELADVLPLDEYIDI